MFIRMFVCVIVFMYIRYSKQITRKKCLNDVVMRVKCSNLINYLSSKQFFFSLSLHFFYWIFVVFVVVAAFFSLLIVLPINIRTSNGIQLQTRDCKQLTPIQSYQLY